MGRAQRDEKRVFTRLQAAFAGMLDHADRHLARLITFLETAGVRDDTLIIVMSDNGASQEGGPLGFINAMGPFNFRPEPMRGKAPPHRRHRRARHPHQLPAWLGDGVEHAAAPLQAEHPWRRHPRSLRDVMAEADQGEGRVRHQFVHACDLVPTLLELIGIEAPARSRARRRCRSKARALPLDHRRSRRRRNHRRNISRCSAIAASGTTAGRRSRSIPPARRSRTTNGSCSISTAISPRSTTSPRKSRERLDEMIKLWWSEAEKHNVLPLDDRFGPRFAENAARFHGARHHFTFHAGMGHVPTDVAPDVRSRSYTIEAHVEIDGPAPRAC